MPNIFSAKFLKPFIDVTRISSPTGFLLCYFPSVFGLILAGNTQDNLYYLWLFFIGSIIVRSSGCIINDLFDRNFDRHIERTKNRPLANDAMTVKQALGLLFILSIMSLSILVTLPKTSILLGFVAAKLIAIYPLMKRYTYYPQIFLGFAFNMGCLIGYSAHTDQISWQAVMLYFACICWTIAYDTIYAFMDIEDDKKIGVKSTAIIMEDLPYKYIILSLYIAFFVLFTHVFQAIISEKSVIFIFASYAIAVYSIMTLNIKDRQNCLLRFKINNLIGFLLSIGIILEKL